MSRSYYIYYRAEASAAQIGAVVRAMQESLAKETGVQGKLLHRCGDTGTWMEVYENIADPEGFERTLHSAVARFGLEALLSTGAARHVECFVSA